MDKLKPFREILFRGQTRRYGEKVRMGDGAKVPSNWVYGGVLQGCGPHSIIYGGGNENDPSEGLNKWVVYTDTIGQFTGLTDKNGKRIFEGDIVKTMSSGAVGVGVVAFGTGTFDSGIYCYTGWHLKDKYGNVDHNELFVYGDEPYYGFEVIGNIHDNPELLEAANERKAD